MRPIYLILLFFLSACSQPEAPLYLAAQGKNQLRATQFSAQDKIALYQLHWQEFLTLRDLLQNWSITQNPQQLISSTLQIPAAPQIEYALKPDWVAGGAQAGLKIQLFCTLVSEPCKRIYQELLQFMPYVQGGMQIQFYESWQPFHKFALEAATAMACVPAQQQADLRQFMLSENVLTPERLDASAALLRFDPVAFKQCRSDIDLRQRFMAQRLAIQNAGLDKPPVLLINSHYLSQADGERLYAYLQSAMPAAGRLKPMPELAVKNMYPLSPAELSFADVVFRGKKQRWSLYQCQDGWCLHQLNAEGLVFFKAGEFYSPQQEGGVTVSQPSLVIQNTPAENASAEDTGQNTAADITAENEGPLVPADDDHATRVRQVLNATPASPLSRVWLEQQLNRQSELEKNFISADLEVEGNHLLKLKPGETDSFYTQLGMQPGDVVMRVNNEWVHDGYNTLWEALRSAERVEISLMRRGLPVHLVYAVQEP